MAYGDSMPLRRPQKLDPTTLKAMAAVLAWGAVLHVGRSLIDAGLRAHAAPAWVPLATAAVTLILWIIGGVWLYARLTRR